MNLHIPDMKNRAVCGRFIINPGQPNEEAINNTIVADGAERFLRSLFRAESVLPASFYLGVTAATYTFTTATLTAIAAGEPGGAEGYARQELPRDTDNWTVEVINNLYRARSAIVSFTATGTWDQDWSRMFLCDVASGTSGLVYALSGPTPAPRQVLSSLAPSLAYEWWLRG